MTEQQLRALTEGLDYKPRRGFFYERVPTKTNKRREGKSRQGQASDHAKKRNEFLRVLEPAPELNVHWRGKDVKRATK